MLRNQGDIMGGPPAKLLDRVRYRIQVKGYSIRTEQSYVSWVRRFILSITSVTLKIWGKMRLRLTLLTWQSISMSHPLCKIAKNW